MGGPKLQTTIHTNQPATPTKSKQDVPHSTVMKNTVFHFMPERSVHIHSLFLFLPFTFCMRRLPDSKPSFLWFPFVWLLTLQLSVSQWLSLVSFENASMNVQKQWLCCLESIKPLLLNCIIRSLTLCHLHTIHIRIKVIRLWVTLFRQTASEIWSLSRTVTTEI